MHFKPDATLNRTVKSLLIPILLLGFLAVCFLNTTLSKDLPDPAKRLDVPRSFLSTNQIQKFFKDRNIPTELKQVQGKRLLYCFASASPYSGVNTTELFCFVKDDAGWALILTATLWKSGSLEFKQNGDFMDVVSFGVVVLKINPPN